jgi:acyl phosphate:glycerol-3-phosphate acyltransferase
MPAHWTTTVLPLIVGAYLLGSVPFGLLIGKARGVDIRTLGSKNIGATNVGRVCGRPWGVLAFALDLLKGLGPTLTAAMALANPTAAAPVAPATRSLCVLGVGMAAVLGHMFPVYLRFRGGKGVATTLGIALGVYPELTWAALAAFGVWVVVTFASRYVSLGSICAAVAFPLALVVSRARNQASLADDWPLVLCTTLLALMIIYRHRTNIKRLFNGTEQRIGGVRRGG